MSALGADLTAVEEMVMALLVEMNATVASLEVTVEHAMLENGVKQLAMDEVTKQYDNDLKEWKSEVGATGQKTKMEIMHAVAIVMQAIEQPMEDAYEMEQPVVDAMVDEGFENVKQPIMDAVTTCKPRNSWDTKRKNKQRARKRQLKLVGTDGDVLEGVDL